MARHVSHCNALRKKNRRLSLQCCPMNDEWKSKFQAFQDPLKQILIDKPPSPLWNRVVQNRGSFLSRKTVQGAEKDPKRRQHKFTSSDFCTKSLHQCGTDQIHKSACAHFFFCSQHHHSHRGSRRPAMLTSLTCTVMTEAPPDNKHRGSLHGRRQTLLCAFLSKQRSLFIHFTRHFPTQPLCAREHFTSFCCFTAGFSLHVQRFYQCVLGHELGNF